MTGREEAMKHFAEETEAIRKAGLYKEELLIASVQGPKVALADGRQVINMCSNNYLGLAGSPRLIQAAGRALDERGYGMSSVRFICGTQDIHKELEEALSRFLGMEDAVLYSSCFDANGGLFETLLTEEDAVISDELNHASIIDGIRLCRAKRYRYGNNDMEDLERQLNAAAVSGTRIRLVVTDGVFSMDGTLANLKGICDLADRYHALVMVDDSHAVGFVGETGRGTPQYWGVEGRVDILTGTLGKALGGASGGYTAARREVTTLLRQRSRPYLFSNTLAPPVVGAGLEAVRMIEESTDLRDRLEENTDRYRKALLREGFDILPGSHPCVPVMLYDERLAADYARRMVEKGVYVTAFSYPVVPRGKARIRTQVSAGHTREDLDRVVSAFAETRREIQDR